MCDRSQPLNRSVRPEGTCRPAAPQKNVMGDPGAERRAAASASVLSGAATRQSGGPEARLIVGVPGLVCTYAQKSGRSQPEIPEKWGI